jgi:hypothetical protein
VQTTHQKMQLSRRMFNPVSKKVFWKKVPIEIDQGMIEILWVYDK